MNTKILALLITLLVLKFGDQSLFVVEVGAEKKLIG